MYEHATDINLSDFPTSSASEKEGTVRVLDEVDAATLKKLYRGFIEGNEKKRMVDVCEKGARKPRLRLQVLVTHAGEEQRCGDTVFSLMFKVQERPGSEERFAKVLG